MGITWIAKYQLFRYNWVLERIDHECKFGQNENWPLESFKVHISGFLIQYNKAYVLVT